MRIKHSSAAIFASGLQHGITLGQMYASASEKQKQLQEDAIRFGLELIKKYNPEMDVPAYEALGGDKLFSFNSIIPEFLQIRDSEIKSIERSREKLRSRFNADGENVDEIDASSLYDVSRITFVVSVPQLAEDISQHYAQRTNIFDPGWRIVPSGYCDRQVIIDNHGLASEIKIEEQYMERAASKDRMIYQLIRRLTANSHQFEMQHIDDTKAAEFATAYNTLMDTFREQNPHYAVTSKKEAVDFQTGEAQGKRYTELLHLQQSVFLTAAHKLSPEWQAMYSALVKKQNSKLPQDLRIDEARLPSDLDPQLLAHYMTDKEFGHTPYAR